MRERGSRRRSLFPGTSSSHHQSHQEAMFEASIHEAGETTVRLLYHIHAWRHAITLAGSWPYMRHIYVCSRQRKVHMQ